MSGMISVIGNLGADAERKEVNGQTVTNMRVGVRVGYGDRAVSTWWDVAVWGKPAEWASELRKGDRVTVMGELQAREHQGTVYMGIRAQSVTGHERRALDSKRQPQAEQPQARGSWGGGGDRW
jgi:single-stranded DNA-binding protein